MIRDFEWVWGYNLLLFKFILVNFGMKVEKVFFEIFLERVVSMLVLVCI